MKCKLTISLFFVLLLSLFIYIDGTVYALILLLSAFLHELGHLLAMKLCGIMPSEIRLLPFGIEIKTHQFTAISYLEEIFIAAAGPLVSLCSALLTFFYILFVGNFYGDLFFTVVSLLFFLVNMLPIESLDGGRILRNILLLLFGMEIGERIANVVSTISTFVLFILGLFLLYLTSYNFSLAVIGAYLLVKQSVWNNFFQRNRGMALQSS